jgi:Putative regulator of cell autolysis
MKKNNVFFENLSKISWKNSLRTRQFSILFLFLFVSVLFSMVLYYNATRAAQQSIYDKMNAQADFYVNSIDQQVGNIKNMMYDVYSTRNLAFLAQPESTLTPYEQRDALLTEQERLISLKNSSLLVSSAVLYLPNANLKISDTLIEPLNSDDLLFLKEHFQATDQIMNFDDNKLFMLSKGAAYQASLEDTDAFFYVELNRENIMEALFNFNTIDNSGSFLYQPHEDIFINSANGKNYGEQILQSIKNKEGIYNNQAKSITVNNERFLTVIRESDIFGVFVQYNPEKEVLRSLQIYKWLVLFYIVMMSILALGFSVYTENNIHKPLRKLLRAFSRVQDRIFMSGPQLKSNKANEFSYLYDGFNQMTQEIKNLIEEVYIQKNLTQKSELKQLQSQINPHFLYNSFFSLSRKIKRGDTSGAEEYAQYLGVFFRFLTKNDSGDVPLFKEIEHARSYTNIQHTRFSDRIHIEFEELPKEFNDFLVPRLILQPIIENAFEHGLENMEEDGVLKITFIDAEPFFEIHVEDNGSDITLEKLELLTGKLTENHSEEITAIINIHRRLQIYFGENSGLTLKKNSLGGLEVIIRMTKSNSQAGYSTAN